MHPLHFKTSFVFQWESVGELNKLKNLEELKFLKNPILETENFNTRTQLIIAKIANLKVYLNMISNSSLQFCISSI